MTQDLLAAIATQRAILDAAERGLAAPEPEQPPAPPEPEPEQPPAPPEPEPEPDPEPPAPTSERVVIDLDFNEPDTSSWLTSGRTRSGLHVEGGSDPLAIRGGKLVKRSSEQFHRIFSTEFFGGTGKRVDIKTRLTATAIRNREGSSIVEGVKLGMKFYNPKSHLARDDVRSAYGYSSSSPYREVSPGSYIFVPGLGERGYVEMSSNGFGREGYRFFPNKRIGYTPGTPVDVHVVVEWLDEGVRATYFHGDKQIYRTLDDDNRFKGEPGRLWIRTDDTDWEMDYLKVTERDLALDTSGALA